MYVDGSREFFTPRQSSTTLIGDSSAHASLLRVSSQWRSPPSKCDLCVSRPARALALTSGFLSFCSGNFNDVLHQVSFRMPTITPFIAVLTCSSLILGLGLPHNYCDEEANEENWDSADQDEWIAGACVQLLGSWRRHRICILGRDNLNEARVKLTPPAIASEYKRHEYSFYMFAPIDEEQQVA